MIIPPSMCAIFKSDNLPIGDWFFVPDRIFLWNGFEQHCWGIWIFEGKKSTYLTWIFPCCFLCSLFLPLYHHTIGNHHPLFWMETLLTLFQFFCWFSEHFSSWLGSFCNCCGGHVADMDCRLEPLAGNSCQRHPAGSSDQVTLSLDWPFCITESLGSLSHLFTWHKYQDDLSFRSVHCFLGHYQGKSIKVDVWVSFIIVWYFQYTQYFVKETFQGTEPHFPQ